MRNPNDANVFVALTLSCLCAAAVRCSSDSAASNAMDARDLSHVLESDVSSSDARDTDAADSRGSLVTLDGLEDFQNPPRTARPKVRFTGADVIPALEELARTGFGGVELAADLNDTAGLATLLSAAHDVGIAVDLSPGGSMPYAVPGIGEADSMQQLCSARSEPLQSDGTMVYRSAAPQPSSAQLAPSPTLKLVAVTAARVVDDKSVPVVLDASSAIDLTPLLANDVVQWTVPNGTWLVFGFWQRATGQTANGFPPFQDPSVWSATVPTESPDHPFMADIFSSSGIAKALAPLASLPEASIDLLRGAQLAHDSHEVQAEMFWTGSLPEAFQASRGYSVIPYLPALHAPKEAAFDPLTHGWGSAPPLIPEFTFSNNIGERVRYDYHRTLNDLYVGEYLETFTQTLHRYGMSSRVQVAYNYLPLNMTRAGTAVDVPENESLDSGWTTANDTSLPMYGTERWRHAVDSYRLTGSAAHLGTGKRASIEFGDDFALYRKQPIDYLAQLNDALAGGITLGLLTGFAGVRSGWPEAEGLEAIGIGDFWTTAWPQWRDWQQLSDYFARATLLLESGKPQVDVLIYLDEGIAGVHELTAPKFASSALETAGFSYDFVDPVTLCLARASEVPGLLFGAGPAYRALVLNQQQHVPTEAARAILAAARGGVRVVVIGDAPSRDSGLHDSATNDAAVAQAMSELLTLANVAQVTSADDVARVLIELDVWPAASFGENSPLMSVHRQAERGDDIYWVWNPSANQVAVTGSFRTQGSPYELDLWNGTISRLALWKSEAGSVVMPLVVPARSAAAFMFQHEPAALHVTETNADGARYRGHELVLYDAKGGDKEASLSDGSAHTLRLAPPPAAMRLDSWTLDVDEIAPSGMTNHHLQLDTLKDWRELPELEYAVGSATYTANADVPESWLGPELDVILDVGELSGAMQLFVNGQVVTRQTTPGGSWAVRQMLRAGTNRIEVRLDTTLINRVLQASGNDGLSSTLPSGLLGPVRLTPIATRRIR